jgi:acetyl esterase/lipase
MVTGAPEMMDIPNQMRAKEHGVAVVAVDYRKAPEFPWPAGPDDGVAVARELLEKGEAEFGSSRMLIGGESAGGYMTAAVALRVRDELGAIDRVDALNLTFGVFDWSRSPSQRVQRPTDEFDVLSGRNRVLHRMLRTRPDIGGAAREISPAYADLRGLPPCLVSVGTCDHLLDDSLLFATRAMAPVSTSTVRRARDAASHDLRLRDHECGSIARTPGSSPPRRRVARASSATTPRVDGLVAEDARLVDRQERRVLAGTGAAVPPGTLPRRAPCCRAPSRCRTPR